MKNTLSFESAFLMFLRMIVQHSIGMNNKKWIFVCFRCWAGLCIIRVSICFIKRAKMGIDYWLRLIAFGVYFLTNPSSLTRLNCHYYFIGCKQEAQLMNFFCKTLSFSTTITVNLRIASKCAGCFFFWTAFLLRCQLLIARKHD